MTPKTLAAMARLLPDMLTVYNEEHREGICWKDTDTPITEREEHALMHLVRELILARGDGSWGSYAFHLREVCTRDRCATFHTTPAQCAEAVLAMVEAMRGNGKPFYQK